MAGYLFSGSVLGSDCYVAPLALGFVWSTRPYTLNGARYSFADPSPVIFGGSSMPYIIPNHGY